MNHLWILAWEFLKIGLFSIGGGLATLPFLYELSNKYIWFPANSIGDMIAISESTPGPLGVNMATYVGFLQSGILGGIIATISLILPSIIIIICISQFLQRFQNSELMQFIFQYLRPAVTGLIAYAGYSVISKELFLQALDGTVLGLSIKDCILFFSFLILSRTYKKHPVFYVGLGALVGVVFQF